MNETEAKQIVRIYVDEAIETNTGAHPFLILRRLRAEHPEVEELSDALLDKALMAMVQKAIKPKRSETMQFAGMGHPIGTTVTVPDGERAYGVKGIRLATIADLEADLDIQRMNVMGAVGALRLAERRNDLLIPVMKEHDFEFAGEALALLGGEAS